jgi:ESS family glutamate:Na+ symporter
MVVAQNGVGVALAKAFGMAPSLGLFVGSIPLLGGHGTAAAWAQAPEASGLAGAFELGIAAATLGLVAGGLVAGPVATALARMARKTSATSDAAPEAPTPGGEPGAGIADILSSDRWLRALLLIAAALAIGQGLQWIAARIGVTVPAFLTAMFGGVILTNLADLVRRPVMAMLSLKLWALLAFVGLLSAMLVAQIAVVVLAGCLLVFPLMGRDHQAAIAAGGFIGFALGAMPVGLGTMRRLSESLGPAPRAFLVLTLAASLFADAANAIGIGTMFALLK